MLAVVSAPLLLAPLLWNLPAGVEIGVDTLIGNGGYDICVVDDDDPR